ncbi:MAG: thiopurine S-methyltransferase [Pseudomonadota bacterium]
MEASFWHERWDAGRTAFHQSNGNPHLAKHIGALNLKRGATVFVPLSGKTRDIAWLLAHGFSVVAVELSQLAIDQLFEDLEVEPDIKNIGDLVLHTAPRLRVFVGNVFALTPDDLGPVEAVYDRAALVALPPDMRLRYAKLIHSLTKGAPQLLVCFEYDQSQMNGPPFAVDQAELCRVHGERYAVHLLARIPVDGGFRAVGSADETIYMLEAYG